MVPGVAVARERLLVGDALRGDDALERIEPVPVIGLAGIGIAGRLRALDLLAEHRRPFRPGEQAARMQRERHGEGLRLPRLAEHRAFLVARNARHRVDRAARSSSGRSMSCRIEIGLERVDRDLRRRIGVRSPQLAALEHARYRAIAGNRPDRPRPCRETRGSRGTSRSCRASRARSAAAACGSADGCSSCARGRRP